LLGVAIGWGAANGLVSSWAEPVQPLPVVNLQERALDANLYMQTAAEYRACCLQVYQCAAERLDAAWLNTRGELLRPAVIMDLDETVLDNSGFQSALFRSGRDFKQDYWDEWERDYPDEVRLVPGAKAFIQKAEKLGVTVVYISNRSEANRQSTIKALKHLGLNTENIDQRLLLQETAKEPKSDKNPANKSPRREKVMARYRVLLVFGDNLRDFSEVFAFPSGIGKEDADKRWQAIQTRYQRVDEAEGHWGVDWFVLPNPVYGEWQKVYGSHPRGLLRPTKMKLAGS